MRLTPAQAELLIGPRPPARTREYYRWKYRFDKLIHPERYAAALARKRATPAK
jgi:hypothetical protein